MPHGLTWQICPHSFLISVFADGAVDTSGECISVQKMRRIEKIRSGKSLSICYNSYFIV